MPELTIQRIVFPSEFELPAPAAALEGLYTRPLSATQTDASGGGLLSRLMESVTARSEDARGKAPLVHNRTSVSLQAGAVLSTDTYFNRVYAGYWHRWTNVRTVMVTAEGRGRARMAVRRSTASGAVTTLRVVEGELEDGLHWEVDLAPSASGGCLWIDLEAVGEDIVVSGAGWHTRVSEDMEVGLDIAICTYDRPHDVLALLRSLRRDEACLEVVDRVWLIDNGHKHVTDLEGADAVVDAWGDRLQHILQPNLGGSGGFSRGLFEASYHGDQPFVMLLDDDVVVEPEGIRRAAVFAALAKRPILVGGQMLNRAEPSVLHSSAEWVDTRTMRWGAAPGAEESIKLPAQRLDQILDAGYNAWWCCLVPTEAVRTAGLGMPFFIKYDDVEFGYRLLKHGFRTVTLPGSAVWHEPWSLKDDTTDWTLYFHVRNRLIFAALISAGLPRKVQRRRVNTVVQDVLKRDVLGSVLRRAYASAATAELAMQDFLRGPEALAEPLQETVLRVREARRVYPDAETQVPGGGWDDTPTSVQRRKGPLLPLGIPQSVLREFGVPVPKLLPIPVHLLNKPSADEWKLWQMPDRDRAVRELPKAADHWWGLMDEPDAWVATVEGGSSTRRVRTPHLSRELTRAAIRTSKTVKERFAELALDYAAAAPGLTSPATWAKQFGIEVDE